MVAIIFNVLFITLQDSQDILHSVSRLFMSATNSRIRKVLVVECGCVVYYRFYYRKSSKNANLIRLPLNPVALKFLRL